MESLLYLCQQLILLPHLLDADHPSEARDSPLKSMIFYYILYDEFYP